MVRAAGGNTMVKRPLSKREEKDPMEQKVKNVEVEVEEEGNGQEGQVLLLKGLPLPATQVTDKTLRKD